MKRLALLMAVVLAFTLSALAQGTSTQESTGTSTSATTKAKKSGKAGAAAKKNTITGCLEKSDGGYKIANAHYKNGIDVKTSEDWSAHAGHKVKLTGTLDKAATPPTFDATSLKHVSDTCSVAMAKAGKTGKKGGKKASENTTGGATETPQTPPK
ncbi:MAG: hypothetical protein ACE14M_10520 [Terriglobales bacterium]